ncbi:efflux RND transporter permease subunit [Caulobacter sp. 17J80-11]|uniref:efflux RND transporter permease subunit n=1 Tax=Caulobacter sp. 17J80-11 TaxID=2763502 RepID=UPI0016537243|nr:efflux RND transporter permease subunit [Caulobacter sp. 17J80-11]MBC6982729.1 efflux RND transporter permease subunit [Caulobacter sp. 17J80-11]
MTLSDISVRRPVFAAVAAIILCVVGLAAFFVLPVRELPDIDPPIVSITTSYTGASAEVIENRITEVIERQVAGIQGVQRITSSSRDGRSNISLEFSLDRNIDDAANDVRDSVSRVVRSLPEQADPPEVAKADADASPVIILSFASDKMSRLELTDYAERYLVERFSTVPGAGQVRVFGDQTYAMRIWLDADQLAARGLTVQDVEAALNSQNAELPAGYLEGQDKDFTIRVARSYGTPQDFAQLPIGKPGANGYVTRLGDVARVEEAASERRRLFRSNGLDQVGIGITRQSQANDLEISKGVREAMEQIKPGLPAGTKLEVIVDNSSFTSEAIREVWITIGISLALVGLVNFIFLGTLRAAIVPTIVAPICLLATFIVLAPLGFSLNLLTLLGLVLAVGLVVDDAIVVVENIQRRVDEGEPAPVAAQRGAKQVFFAVVATTMVLIAVFAPLLFLPGYIGRLFVELAAAIAAAVAFSAFLALSLSPMLASKLLRPAHGEGFVARHMDRAMDALRDSYRNSLDSLLGKKSAAIAVGGLTLVAALSAAGLFFALPQELVPPEDRGRVDVRLQGPEGAGYDYMVKQSSKLEKALAKEVGHGGPAERYMISLPGFGGASFNGGSGVLVLNEMADRSESADEIAARLNKSLSGITGARVIASVRGPFQRGGGGGGGANVDFIAVGTDYDELQRWMQPILQAANDNPGLVRPRLDYEPNAPRLLVDIDREKAAALGVSSTDIGRALETMFGSRRATTYIKGGQEYDVRLQTDLEQRRGVEDLNSLYVRSASGQLVPLASVVKTELKGDTPDRKRLDRLRAITLTAELQPGYTVKDAVSFFQTEAAKQPAGPSVRWGGQARDLLEAGGAVGVAFGLALLLVFLVLAAQFESWINPAIIMLTVPLAALGGLFGLLMAGSSLNIYSQIGLIILIGIAAKNGILIVEFSNQLRDEGRSVREAVIEASSLRLRPIIMTSIATAFGALPLVLWEGAGAASRQTIGVVIFAGAIFATLLTLFVVPMFYNLLARFTKSPEHTARQIEAWEEGEKVANDRLDEAAE